MVVQKPRVEKVCSKLDTQNQSGIELSSLDSLNSLLASNFFSFLGCCERKPNLEDLSFWTFCDSVINKSNLSLGMSYIRLNRSNSTGICSSKFSTVSVFFLIKNVLVPRTSHVKGLHLSTIFLPVPDNRFWRTLRRQCRNRIKM